jgi:Xaa-Pro aminopeptidase
MTLLANQLRSKVFRELPEGVLLVVSADPINKSYLSGYVSMAHDLAPAYRSAALATRDGVFLVVSAADAGPALAFIENPELIERYGTFYFEAAFRSSGDFRKEAHATFEEALAKSLEGIASQSGLIAVDRANDDVAWAMSCQVLGDSRVIDATAAIARARMTKLPGEVDRLRVASRAVEDGFRWVGQHGKAGMTELELAAAMAQHMVAGGAVPRFISVTSGPRSALADAYPTPRVIGKGEMIRVDAGCTVDGYWSDIARSFVFGEPSTRQRKTYQALQKGLEQEVAALRDGLVANQLFDTTVEAVRAAGLPHYRRQHCGHGIGLRSYDSPVIGPSDGTALLTDMCLCLETPYYELGVDGMMIEDMVRVTASGHERLTSLSQDLIIVA